jgi:antitoxin component of RelBE/YafQ-DinJ toxin-antitoxin module
MKKTKTVVVRFPAEYFSRYEAIIKSSGLTVSGVIRLALYYFVDTCIATSKTKGK